MGAILLTASHNPGGPTEDFGIKFNSANGGPAPETLTNLIFEKSKTIQRYFTLSNPSLPEIDLKLVNDSVFQLDDGKTFKVSVVDSCQAYINLMQELFNFDSLRQLMQRKDF